MFSDGQLDPGFMLVISCNKHTIWPTTAEVCGMLPERPWRGKFKVKREESAPEGHSVDTWKDHQSHCQPWEEGMHNIVTFSAGKRGGGGSKKQANEGKQKYLYLYL